jgi:hypothetical protein
LRDPGEGEESLKELNLNWRGGTLDWVFAKVGVLERQRELMLRTKQFKMFCDPLLLKVEARTSFPMQMHLCYSSLVSDIRGCPLVLWLVVKKVGGKA